MPDDTDDTRIFNETPYKVMHERNFFRKNPDENLYLDLTVTKLGVP